MKPDFLMLLLIDIGNSNTKIGFHDAGELKGVLRLKTGAGEYIDDIRGFIKQHGMQIPEGACICSVVPEVTPSLTSAVKDAFNISPVVVSYEMKSGLAFSIENCEGLGADRIANAAAAHKLYARDMIVVDFGTATTFCVINSEGEYKGGAIMPGPGLSVDSLFDKTSKLPKIELRPVDRVVGKSTDDNIRSGVILGHAGAVERIISEINEELNMEAAVVLTGGYAGLLESYIKADYINPDLTLEGLRIIYELNFRTLTNKF